MYDAVVIGAGVCGCATGRELTRYDLKIAVIERCCDVAMGTTRANSAIVHAGYDAVPGSNKALYNRKGKALFPVWCGELEVPYRQNGSLVLSFTEEGIAGLRELMERGIENGVRGLEILSGDEVRKRNPNISGEVKAALYAPDAGITCPYELTVALYENAVENGASFRFGRTVTGIRRTNDAYEIRLDTGETIEAKTVINAAGVYADDINNMVSDRKITIIPRKGEYGIFDKEYAYLTDMTIFQLPTKMGKGVLVAKTVDGNIIAGPTAVDVEDKEDVSTTKEGIDSVMERARLSVPALSRGLITTFAGLRAHAEGDDFIIGEAEDAGGFFNIAGIESPGLTGAPAIGHDIAELVAARLNAREKPSFDPKRKAIPRFKELSRDEQNELIRRDPSYGKIVCRCETVTEGEVVEAVKRMHGNATVDGVKRRTRAGMGRCQTGFCGTRVLEIIARVDDIAPERVTKSGPGSELLTAQNKSAAMGGSLDDR